MNLMTEIPRHSNRPPHTPAMTNFEKHLQALVLHAQQRVHACAFVMYQPPYLTIAHFDTAGALVVVADAQIDVDYTKTFTQLYSQLNAHTNSMRGTEL